MIFKRLTLFILAYVLLPLNAFAQYSDVSRAVWVNEAIVATYTYNYTNFLQRQKQIAHYFTSDGWIAFSKALYEAKLPEVIKQNDYYVSAVATDAPEIKELSTGHWQATMPLLVIYKNPQYQQKQTLEVTITFKIAPPGQGIRGLAITSLKSKETKPACKCPAS